jgi:hypothetical protein
MPLTGFFLQPQAEIAKDFEVVLKVSFNGKVDESVFRQDAT